MTTYTTEIYNHLFHVLEEAAQIRPMLGLVKTDNERAYATDGYVLFDFPLAAIDKEEWLSEYYMKWEERSGNIAEKINNRYFGFPDGYEGDWDKLIAKPDKLGAFLPCATPLIEGEVRYPNPDFHKDFQWRFLDNYRPESLWGICYKARREAMKQGIQPALLLENAERHLLLDILEAVLSFPLVILEENISIYTNGDAFKIIAGDTLIIAMGMSKE